MRISTLLAGLAATTATAQSSTTPGYFTNYTSVTNTSLSFGTHFAVLNLDLINGLVGSVAGTPAGNAFINSTSTWINAVHAHSSPVLSIFTRIYFSNALRPEIGPSTPFAQTIASLPGNQTASDPATEIYPSFSVNSTTDVVLQKTRYYAGFGNQLENILRSQQIDTVIISGIRTSGVVLNTAYELFNLNYKVYVIIENSIETAPDAGSAIDKAIKEGVIPKLPADVITLEQAMAALKRSKGNVY